MNSIQESFLKSLNPSIAVKVSNLDNDTIPREVLLNIHQVLTYKYKTFLDEENGVIYIGKKV